MRSRVGSRTVQPAAARIRSAGAKGAAPKDVAKARSGVATGAAPRGCQGAWAEPPAAKNWFEDVQKIYLERHPRGGYYEV